MKSLSLFIAIAFIVGCKDSKKPSYSKKSNISDTQKNVGKKLMETNCYICHNPTTKGENRIAPPMIAIKKHYLKDHKSKETFVNSIQEFIKNPTKENAIMFGAVKRFGAMPKQVFPEQTIQLISEYLFDNEIEKPVFFEKNHKNEQGKVKQKQQKGNNFKNLPYKERGLKYALTTKAVLGINLMGKIQKEGTLAALKFCNLKALTLTDSMSVVHNATIKRVSDKPRNLKNAANSIEEEYIAVYKEEAKLNKESKPIVVETAENVTVYYPIKTNGMCLQCHGKPNTDIKPTTLLQLKILYPKDMAIGYNENEIRGIWNIQFNK